MNVKKKSLILILLILLSIGIFIRRVDRNKEMEVIENRELEKFTYEDIHKFYSDKILLFASENNLEVETMEFYENRNVLDGNTGNLKYNNIEIELLYNLKDDEDDILQTRKEKLEKIIEDFDEIVLNSSFMEFEKLDKVNVEILDLKYNISDSVNYIINNGNVLGYPNSHYEDEEFKEIKDIVNCEIIDEKGLNLLSLGRDRESLDYIIILDAKDVENQEKIKKKNYKKYKKISDNIYEKLKQEKLNYYIKNQDVYNMRVIFKGECNSNKENKEFIYEI